MASRVGIWQCNSYVNSKNELVDCECGQCKNIVVTEEQLKALHKATKKHRGKK